MKRAAMASVGVWLLSAAACGTDGGAGPRAEKACASTAECAGEQDTQGMLCLEGRCRPCAQSWQCERDPQYGAGRLCTAGRCVVPGEPPPGCTPGTAGCFCDGAACEDGLVCVGASETCRAPLTCSQVSCSAGEVCRRPAAGDAHCSPGCAPGFVWRAARQACVRIGGTCAEGEAASIAGSCRELGRECVEDTGEAWCGACTAGTVAEGSLCAPRVTCDSLDCGARGRACVSEPDGRCGGCLPGYVDIGDGERCLATCAGLSCGEGSECVERSESEPARCVVQRDACGAVPVCGDGRAWSPYARACVDCGNVVCEVNDAQTGELYPVVTNQGRCVCATRAGSYFDHGTNRVEPCDADGDGFVRRSAWPAMQAKPADACGGDLTNPDCDCAVRANAKCAVLAVDRFVLESVDGYEHEVAVAQDPATATYARSGRLELYEVDGNDDFGRRGSLDVPELPAYESGLAAYTASGPAGAVAGRLAARELNSFTKACVDGRADFNGNRRADVGEYQGMPLDDGSWLAPFTAFSYFVELYEGAFEATEGNVGIYRIRERGRRAGEGSTTALVPMMAGVSDYSTQCQRLTDAAYTSMPSARQPNTGMDFARYNPPNAALGTTDSQGRVVLAQWLGHHSQFKCVELVGRHSRPSPREVPHEVLLANADDYRLHGCFLDEGLSAAADVACAPVAATPAEGGAVGWAAVRYRAYETRAGYQRGCINECVEQAELPAAKSCSATQVCVADANDFGKVTCPCKPTHTGSDCTIACGYYFIDGDHDGHALAGSTQVQRCTPPDADPRWRYTGHGKGLAPEDCAGDNDGMVYPGAPEICDGKDNDCDAATADGAGECLGDVCNTGVCTHGQCGLVAKCNDGNLCTNDTCDARTGACEYTSKCWDGISCTTDICDAGTGQCRYVSNCDATGNECTYYECTTGGCVLRNQGNGTSCGRTCYADTCRNGACVPGGYICPACKRCTSTQKCCGGTCPDGGCDDTCISQSQDCP